MVGVITNARQSVVVVVVVVVIVTIHERLLYLSRGQLFLIIQFWARIRFFRFRCMRIMSLRGGLSFLRIVDGHLPRTGPGVASEK